MRLSIIITFVIITLLHLPFYPQSSRECDSIPKDNYFTLESASQKVHKKYPDAILATEKKTANVATYCKIVYKSIGCRNLHLNIWKPDTISCKKLPCVIIIHGGGWRSGNYEMECAQAEEIAIHGFITASIEYRLSPEAKYPAAIEDIRDAIAWLIKHASEYKINVNKLAISGASSGGQLATLIGLMPSAIYSEENSLHESCPIQAIINIDGYVDFTKSDAVLADTLDGSPSSETRWLGYSYRQNPKRWMEASPINYVTSHSAPVLFINSSLDRYHAGRDQMIALLNLHRIYYEVHTIKDSPHPFWLFHPWFNETTQIMIRFLQIVFKEN